MALFNVYISEYSYKDEYKPAKRLGREAAGYQRCVRATSRTEALNKCLPDIQQEFPKLKGSRVSVLVGSKVAKNASRLSPMTVKIE